MHKVHIVLLHPCKFTNQLKLHIGQVIILTVGISRQVCQEIFISIKPNLSVLTIINKIKNYLHHYLLVEILCFQSAGKVNRNNHL
jgi:hypothetical protein